MPKAFSSLAAPPVFITGYGRSGTTWTLDIFACHPKVCAIFETWLLTRQEGVVGVFHQPQWVSQYYEDRREGIGLEHGAVQLVGYDEMARDLGALVAGWMTRRLRPGQSYLVEKGPIDIPAAAAMFPEARFVHVIRDGRDVALSHARAAASWAPEMNKKRPLASFARPWRQAVARRRIDGAALGDRYLEVRFEDMTRDVRSVASGLFEFAEIPLDGDTLELVSKKTSLSAYDESVRQSGFRGEGRDGAWSEVMTPEDARSFDAEAGDLLVDLGYAEGRDWWRVRASV